MSSSHPTTWTQPISDKTLARCCVAIMFGYSVEFGLGALTGLLAPSHERSTALSGWGIFLNHVPGWVIGLACAAVAIILLAYEAFRASRPPDGDSSHPREGWATRLLRAFRTTLADVAVGDRRAPRGAGLATFGLVWVSLLAGAGATTLATQWGILPAASFDWPAFSSAVAMANGLVAGTGEEPLVVVLPILLWQRRRGRHLDLPAWGFLTLLVAARMLYHLYYGWPVLALLPWAVAMVAVFWTWRQAWALMLGHWFYYANHFVDATWWLWAMFAAGAALMASGLWMVRLGEKSHA